MGGDEAVLISSTDLISDTWRRGYSWQSKQKQVNFSVINIERLDLCHISSFQFFNNNYQHLQMPKAHTRVLLVDDHVMLRKGMLLLLTEEPDIEVVGEAGDSEEASSQVSSLQPDIVMMGIDTPRINGIEATRQIVKKFPQIKVIAFSSHSSNSFVDDMLNAGASGYLPKDCPPEELMKAIRTVSQGEKYLSEAITGTILKAYVKRISNKQSNNRPREDVPVLRTKLHPPLTMPDMVPRMRLVDHLDDGQVQPLILISAPAGYGKSILVSSWLENCGWPSSWISLEQSDSDIRQFLLYFVSAVRNIFPNACKNTLTIVNAPQLPSLPTLAATFSNDLGEIKKPFILVLDDYYRIDVNSPVNDLLYHLLERPPLPLHLVIITRRDPPLQIVTLRAKGQVTELRMQDLCFTREETKMLLENSATFTADDETLDDLEREIEGWAVGLRLVSQVLSSNQKRDEFLQNLHAGVQQTNAYLLQEVFVRQPPELQDYLLVSSILDRFSAPLCEAVCHFDNDHLVPKVSAEKFINELTDRNLFTISLDSQGKWFRFHHLFQQLLREELAKRMSSNEIARLHVHASQWFKEQNFFDEAIQHLLTAGDTVGAAKIIEHHHQLSEQKKYWWKNLQRWLSLLPEEIKKHRPALLLSQAWVMHFRYQLQEIAPLVRQIELLAMEKPLDEICTMELKIFQGILHYWAGNGETALQRLSEAQKHIPPKYHSMTTLIDTYVAMASQMIGQGKASLRKLNKTIEQCDQLNKALFTRLILARTFSHILSGKLTPAVQDAKRINHALRQSDFSIIYGWGDYIAASSYFRLNNLQPALIHFSSTVKFLYSIHTRVAADSMIGLALVNQAIGETDAATDTMDKLLDFIKETGQTQLLAVAQSGQARLALAQGDLNLASDWLQSFDGKPFIPTMSLWLENPVITQIRVLLAIASPETLKQANTLLASMRQETEALHNTCQLIEIMALQVLALEKLGYGAASLNALKELIALTEPGQWIRPFVELGLPMAKIVQRLSDQAGSTDYLHRILTQCKPVKAASLNITGKPPQSFPGKETLTNRELDILELLTQRLQNKEIATHLFVSIETIKTHLKHLYKKLGVSNRQEAATVALEILSPKK